jgi:hypothetical protein
VRAFNRLTAKWRSKTGDSPVRDLSNVLCIAETLRRFDVVAVQEVGSTAEAIKATMSYLGGDWAFLVTDVTLGDAGNHQRLAFVFDRERLRPSGLACELVLAPEDFGVSTDVLGRQFARTPYGVSFVREPNCSRSSRSTSSTATPPAIASASWRRSPSGWPTGRPPATSGART